MKALQSKMQKARRIRRAGATASAATAMAVLTGVVLAQTAPGTPHLVENSGLLGNSQNVLGIGVAAKTAAGVPGTPFAELLRGNGSRAGYTLSHGGVIADTLSVRVSGQTLKVERDYWLDAGNGTLFFAQAVRPADTISIYYRYVDGQDGQRQPLSLQHRRR